MSSIQTIIFPKDKFSKRDAVAFLKRNNFKFEKVDETTQSLRFRQRPVGTGRKRTISLGDPKRGISAVVTFPPRQRVAVPRRR